MTQSTLAMDLGHEELVFLLWLMRTPTLPGLGPDPLAGLSGDTAARALAAAEHALVARGLIGAKGPEGTVSIDEVALALVGTCAAADTTALYGQIRQGKLPALHYLYATRRLSVEHTNPQPGVHRFEALGNRERLSARLHELIGLGDRPAPAGEPADFSEESLRKAAEDIAAGNPDGALQSFTGDGLNPESARRVLGTLGSLARTSLVAVQRRNGQERSEAGGLILLESSDGLWELASEPADAGSQVTLRPRGAVEIRASLAALLEP